MKIGGVLYFMTYIFISRQGQTTWNADRADDADTRGFDICENPRNPRHLCSIYTKFKEIEKKHKGKLLEGKWE